MATAETTRRPRTLAVAAKDLLPGDRIYNDDGEISRVVQFIDPEETGGELHVELEGAGAPFLGFPNVDEEVRVLQKDRGKIAPLPGFTRGVVLANVPTAAVEAWSVEQIARIRELADFVRRADAVLVKAEPGDRGEAMNELGDKYGVLESWIVPVRDWEPNADDVVPPYLLPKTDSVEQLAEGTAVTTTSPEGATTAHEGVIEEATRKLGDVVEHLVTEALDTPEKPEHGKDPVDEGRGRLAFDTGDEPTITNEVIGPRPSKAALVFTAKPKPIPVKRNYQPGENSIVLLWCAVGRATVGGEIREHEFTPLETLLWEDAHLEPGKALEELRHLETRDQFARAIVDTAVHFAETLREKNTYESDVDFLTDLRDKLYDRYKLTDPAPPAPVTVDAGGIIETSGDRGREEFYDPATASAVHAGVLSPDQLEEVSEILTQQMRGAGHEDATVTLSRVGPDDIDQRIADELGVAVEARSFLDDGPPRRVEPQQDAESLTLRWDRLQQHIDDADPGSEALLAYSEEAEHVRQLIIDAGGVDPESAEAYEHRDLARAREASDEADRAATAANEEAALELDEIVDAEVVEDSELGDEVDRW